MQGHKHLDQRRGRGRRRQGSRESHQRDLFDAIERGEFPKWKMQRADHAGGRCGQDAYNPFDLTKVWPHGDYPLIDVGILELNRNPDNYFAEIEQAAFSPSNVVPGIGFSPGQDAAGAHLFLRRRAPLPARHALRERCRSTAEGARCTTTTRTARCVSTPTATRPTPITSRTRSAARSRTRASRSRR